MLHPCSGPLKRARLDLATGTLTRGPSVNERAGNTIADLTNLDLGAYFGLETGDGACEWIDAATKGFASNASDLVSDIVFAYCSVMLDPASGGPGSSVLLGFYEGYAVGGPAPTTNVALYNLTGLPGHNHATSGSPFSGDLTCRYLHLDLASCLAFADGPIGYSWRFMDHGTTNVLAGTFPVLSCVQSCTGAGPDGQGMVDLLDKFCPPGQFVSTFTFTSPPPGSALSGDPFYTTSIAMDVV